MPNIAMMSIITCRGDRCKCVEFTVPGDYKYLDDFYGGDLCYEYRGRILEDANYPITAKCGKCGTNRYSVRFIKWIEWTDPNGNTNCLDGMAHEQHVVIEWNNGPVAVEKLVSEEPITLDVAVAHYEREGANFERDSITLVDTPEMIELTKTCQTYNRDRPDEQVDMAFVIMYSDPNREVVAIMPGLAGTVGQVYSCTCYVHMGQHSAADIEVIGSTYENATPDEYAELKLELERIGYFIYVIPKSRIGNTEYADMRRKELGL